VTRLMFIDFDGVLHPMDEVHRPAGWFRWLPVLADLLAPWPDVRLVIHSSWRYEYSDTELRVLMGPLSSRVFGSVPPLPREQAIENFLQANKAKVVSHLVLDDDAREFTAGRLNLVLCDSLEGLTQRRVQDRVRHWLATTATDTRGASYVPRRTKGYGRKLLYLDFDGVLHHEDVRWRPKRGAYLHQAGHFLFEHAALLNDTLEPFHDLDIVLSTSWVRKYSCHQSAQRLPPGLRRRVVGATFHSAMDRNEFALLARGQQVYADVVRRRPADWCALDDVDEGWPDSLRERFVLTDPVLGITSPEAMQGLQANLDRMFPTDRG